MRNHLFLGAILCFIAAVSWGAMFPVAHAAFKHIDPFYFTIIRYGSVTVILAVILLWKEGKRTFRFEGKGLRLWLYGTMGFTVYNLLVFWGEDLLGASGVMSAAIMESLMPMISIIIVWMFFKKRPHLFTLLCVLLSFAGAVLVITKGDITTFLGATERFFPSVLLLAGVIGWVVYTMGASSFRGWSALRYSTLSCLLGTITALCVTAGAALFGAVSAPSGEDIRAVSPHLLFMILFPGVIALLGWNIGVSILSPLNGLLFINFVPVTTLAISISQGNQVTMFDLIGTVFIIVSLVSNNIYVRAKQGDGSRVSLDYSN
ncbi:DMT family transporter [Bacillus benzoevorans]|uniref:Drug/metabolite transporter (DMT)-like permease n=1 Tax=Bacillus benzoevorans TaxID=1456 RepID=A0A7X0LYK6_9BACI|nr:DMT family transporter [Bacillus benzoevorans]MBB6447612.1 drug/metabolite transporter (DMT)-like permease [Bacillus benzoevorans]